MISIFAPAGIGEVGPGTDLAAEILRAVAADPSGPLRSGDIVVVTSKIISKAESRYSPAEDREAAIDAESRGTVARRGPTRIVRTRHGLTLAAAGVDNSNVDPRSILLLPVDPDASAARLRAELQARTGTELGLVISDTAGRAWRIGQTDQAIGAAGVLVVERYAGRRDSYGNELQVTAVAIADELAAAADLVKSKLRDRPVAVVRGLHRYVVSDPRPCASGSADAAAPDGTAGGSGAPGGVRPDGAPVETEAAVLNRDAASDMFRYGSREAVLAAVLQATGRADHYEETLALPTPEAVVESAVGGSGRTGGEADLLRRVLRAAFGS